MVHPSDVLGLLELVLVQSQYLVILEKSLFSLMHSYPGGRLGERLTVSIFGSVVGSFLNEASHSKGSVPVNLLRSWG